MHTYHDYSGITQHVKLFGMDGSTQSRMMITEKLRVSTWLRVRDLRGVDVRIDLATVPGGIVNWEKQN